MKALTKTGKSAVVGGIGLLQGLFGGAVGLGGGTVALPLLKHGAKFNQHQASGITLPAVFISGLFGGAVFFTQGRAADDEADPDEAIAKEANAADGERHAEALGEIDETHKKTNKEIDLWNVGLVAACAAAAAPMGARMAHRMKSSTLSRMLGVFLLGITPVVIYKESLFPNAVNLSEDQVRAGLVATGAVAGVATGLFGVGGGAVKVPLLSLLIGHQASLGTSLLTMLPPTALAMVSYHRNGYILWRYVPFLVLGAAAGSYVSARFTTSLTEEQQRRLFACVMIPLGIFTLIAG